MFTLYNPDKNKKKEGVVIFSLEEKQARVKGLIKALNLNVLPGYTGNESEKTILKKEQAEDNNRKKKIEHLQERINRISQQDKERAENLQNLISQKEKIISLIDEEIKALINRKNKAIEGLADQHEDVGDQQAYLNKIYIAEESPRVEKRFRALKAALINFSQETLADEIRERLQAVIPAGGQCDYHIVIIGLQNLRADLMVAKDEDLQNLNSMDIIKLPKKLATQKALFQKYQDYLKEHKKDRARSRISPAQLRTKIIMEANILRAKLNKEVAERVNQKYKEKQQLGMAAHPEGKMNDMGSTYINVAAQYCIAKLEGVDPSVEAMLQKNCINAGWVLDKKGELLYKNKQNNILSMSEMYELSFKAYVHVAKQFLAQKPGMNLKNSPILKPQSAEPISLENFQMVPAHLAKLNPLKNTLPAFEQAIKNSKQKIVPYDPYRKPLSFGLFCLDKALVSMQPELRGIREVKASLPEAISKNRLGINFQKLNNLVVF